MTPKEQVEGLMGELLAFAEKMLNEHGEFHPFGGYLTAPTTMVHVGVESKGDPHNAQKKIDALVESFKEMSSRAIAFGIVSDVSLSSEDGLKRDAVKIFLEHRDGYCAEVFFPYETSPAGGVEVVETIAQQGVPVFFTRKHGSENN